ncbi:hypothetical protein EV426DRAFT_643758 [Tirmania nivea]|nr:hypothetical protein EV426DRAFT_643758 [Tirmania nivea]
MYGSEWQSADADTNDEGSLVEERGRSMAPREATPGQGFPNTLLGARSEVERTYSYAAPSLQGNQHSAAPPRRDTRQSISSYGHVCPYFKPSGQVIRGLESEAHYGQREGQDSLRPGIERVLCDTPNFLPQYPRDDHETADAADVVPTVNRCRAPSPQTSSDYQGRQPTLLMSANRPAPRQLVIPDRRQIRAGHSRQDARSQSPSSAQSRPICNASYNRERSLSLPSLDRCSTQMSPTASARLQRREERGYNMNPLPGHMSAGRRPATHRNFPRSTMSREDGPTHQRSTSLGEAQESPTQSPRAFSSLPILLGSEEPNKEPDIGDWRTIIPQARQVLGRLTKFLSPELCDGLTRVVIKAAEAPYPADLARRAEVVSDTRQPEQGARPQVQQDSQADNNRRATPRTSKPDRGDRGGKFAGPVTRRADQTMAVRNILNPPDKSQMQHKEEGAMNDETEEALALPGPPKPTGKRPPGSPRKDDPYRPEPRRKSVAPLPGEKPHVGRPKNVEIKTREQYHGGKLDYTTAVYAIKNVSKRTQFVPPSNCPHDQSNVNVDQTGKGTVLSLPAPEPNQVARRPPAARPVPRGVQQTRGETQTQSVPQILAESTSMALTVVEQRAPPTEAADPSDQVVGVGVRRQFPGRVSTYSPRLSTTAATIAAAPGLRRSARTAFRQGSAQPIATSSRPQSIPGPPIVNVATGTTRPTEEGNLLEVQGTAIHVTSPGHATRTNRKRKNSSTGGSEDGGNNAVGQKSELRRSLRDDKETRNENENNHEV